MHFICDEPLIQKPVCALTLVLKHSISFLIPISEHCLGCVSNSDQDQQRKKKWKKMSSNQRMMEEYQRKKEERERKREVRKNGSVHYKTFVLLNHAK